VFPKRKQVLNKNSIIFQLEISKSQKEDKALQVLRSIENLGNAFEQNEGSFNTCDSFFGKSTVKCYPPHSILK
jgi:hypothetical protein